jgi:uncharacterized membrane protein YedE/YeeE
MTFPLWSLSAEHRALGLLVSLAIGFLFGFVLERAGFGRAQKLVGQFFGHDLTVFKVMFSAVVTAMLGSVVLDGLGVIDLRAVAEHATSETFLWPMLVGGVALGMGFILSGYCPGTSYVAAASGKLDGLATVAGTVVGQVAYASLEHQPWLARLHGSGARGHLFLPDLLGLPRSVGPAVVAVGVTAVAVACFWGAETLEKALAARAPAPASPAGRPGRLVLAGFGALAAIGLAATALPGRAPGAERRAEAIAAPALARRVLDEPWKLRVLDVRDAAACAAARVPGAECAPPASLAALGLADDAGGRDLVLVADGTASLPPDVAAYPGRVLALEGGWEAWRTFALLAPPPPAPDAREEERALHRLRAGLASALTGVRTPPPPPPSGAAAAPRRKGGGGCGG